MGGLPGRERMEEKGKKKGTDAERRFDARGAREYDDRIRASVPGYEALHEMARALLERRLGQGARLLVAGSGTGAEIVRLGEGNPGWRFTGVDPSADMVSVCRRRVAEKGLSGRVELRTGFVHELPASDPYDAATLVLVMHFLPDDGQKLDLLRSVAARLRPGAPFVLADMHGDETSERFADFVAAWKLRQLALGVPGDAAEERLRQALSSVRFVPEGRILELLGEAGFVDAEPFYRALLFGGWVARKAGRPGPRRNRAWAPVPAEGPPARH